MNSGKPLVSILLPFHNAGDDFLAALRSILSQTYEHWELLLCDDGSTDGSLDVANSIGDQRVTVWSDGRRVGLAARLNECIDRARGELIARMDADDVSYPERLRNQVEYLLRHPRVDLVGCQMLIFGDHGTPLGQRRLPLEHEEIVARPHVGFGLAHPTWMARAEWFRKHRYDLAAIRYEDVELLYRSYQGSRFANLPEILYGYREMRGGFRKRLKTRLGRIRYLKARQKMTGRVTYIRAAVAETIKIVGDAALVAGSARYAMLRAREIPLSAEENAAWRNVYRDVQEAEAPLRMMVITTVPETMTFLARQIHLMNHCGFSVHAVSSPGGDARGLDEMSGVVKHRVPMVRRPNPMRDSVSVFRLLRLMRRVRPDIVHAHTPKAGLLGMAAAKLAGIPVRLYTIHGLPLMTRTGVWRRVLELAERASCALATKVFTVSPSIQAVVTETRLCPAHKVSTVGDGSCAGIDVDRFSPGAHLEERSAAVRSAWGIPRYATLLSFVGRIARDKGLAVLAAAWADLAPRYPNAHLLIAGIEDRSDPVPESVLAELQRDQRVHFTRAWVRDMPALYAATDILVLPTFREGLPQVALEAGAMRVPVVSTRIPGVSNAVQDGVTGLLVAPRESAPFAVALQRLLDDAALREEMGKAAREFVCTRFSEVLVNQLWISEFRKLARESSRGFMKRLAHIENPR